MEAHGAVDAATEIERHRLDHGDNEVSFRKQDISTHSGHCQATPFGSMSSRSRATGSVVFFVVIDGETEEENHRTLHADRPHQWQTSRRQALATSRRAKDRRQINLGLGCPQGSDTRWIERRRHRRRQCTSLHRSSSPPSRFF